MHQSAFKKAQFFRKTYLSEFEEQPLDILDVGSAIVDEDTESNGQVFANPSWQYRGLDIEAGKNVDVVVADPYDWAELENSSVDLVTCSQVFEHTSHFWLTILEMARVLRTNGLVLILAPGAGPLHRYPVDCWRFYDDGLPSLADWAMLDVVDSRVQWHPAYGKGDIWRDAAIVLQKRDLGPEDNERRVQRILNGKAAYHATATPAESQAENVEQQSILPVFEYAARFEREEARLLSNRPALSTKLSLIRMKLREIKRIALRPLDQIGQ